MSLRRLGLAGCLVLAVLGAVPAAASAFGTVRILGQRAEHERITRLALAAATGRPTTAPASSAPRSTRSRGRT